MLNPAAAHLTLAAEQQVALLADVHLQEAEPETFALWRQTLETLPADVCFILGDCFEVWVGDDWGLQDPFAQACAEVLRGLSARMPVYFLHGNRDFLLGPDFAAHCGMQLLPEQLVLHWGARRVLLAHGDAWMHGDAAYMAFRQQVRQAAWQTEFLAQPLAQRVQLAQEMRAKSAAAQQGKGYADIDMAAAAQAMQAVGAPWLIHGHTHKAGCGTLGPGLLRWVLSDWDALGRRGDVLLLREGQVQRWALGMAAPFAGAE